MKVLHILDALNRGGAEMLALDVCRNAGATGLDLTFAATGGGEMESDFRDSGVDYVRLRRRLPVDPRLVRQLRRLVRARGIQVAHSHQAVEALHAYLATRGTNVKCVLSFHGCVPDAKNRVAWRYLVPRMDANIAVSAEFRRHLRDAEKLIKGNFHVLPNGVDARRLQPTGKDVRAELGLNDQHLWLGMVGNFYSAAKDQLTVCRALPEVLRRHSQAQFVFVGGRSRTAPQLYDDCMRFCREQRIDDRVHFLGTRADVPDVLRALDVFIFSSLQDTFGNAVIEAMMTGVPCVVSDIPPLREIAGDGAYAQLFRPGDASDLAAQLGALLDRPERRAQLRDAARAWASAQFSIEAHLERLQSLYAGLIRDDGQATQ